MYVLIIEDNPDIVANLFAFLEPQGYILDVARNGNMGMKQAVTGAYDVVVLDLSLPGMDGIEVCRLLRDEYRIATPVLMLTARDTERDKLAGFNVGTDDYLVKPYSLAELDARLKALVRRSNNRQTGYTMTFGGISVNTRTGVVVRAGKQLALTPTGYKILLTLLRRAPDVVKREILEREIWGDDPPESDALRTHIHALRQALDKPFDQPMLFTRPGFGYALASSDET